MPYSAPDYWLELHQRDNLSAVGQSALPPEINAWLYRAMARNLRRFLRRRDLDRPAPRTVLDVGAGTGYWVGFWQARGALVDGCDLVPLAVDRLNGKFGSAGRFWVADVAQPASLGDRTYDLVTCLNVLLHVTEESAFEEALANVAAAVAPGGHLLLAEPILLHPELERPYDPNRHSRARALATYADPLIAAGLELVAVEAATVLANNPIEAGSPRAMARLQSWWRWVAGRSKANPRSARWIGPIVYAGDWLAMHSGAAPSGKFALFRRPA
jgi:SAM-dependent methyltransferase